ncbi:GntR family transcriptional regulator [Planctomicrobium sp. SH664]|uniref:GntR family transcriptional regulator n=1 Tax=Planctomicrobium sp. SH664 TaxID=3448125 RepID=UPI003F5B9C4A
MMTTLPVQEQERMNALQSKTTLTELAYQEIRRRILNLEFAPGSVVSERMLSETLGMGKAPIRAALIRLAAERIVTIASRQGIVIATASIQDILEMFHMRFALETLIVREIAGKLNEEQRARLEANVDHYKELADEGNVERTIAIDFEFHRMLAEFHGNRQMLRVLNSVYDFLYREVLQAQSTTAQRLQQAYHEHLAIAEAVLRNDPQAAEEAMKTHLQCGEQVLLSRSPR